MMKTLSNIPAPGAKKRVVIVGAGFAGLKLARKLSDKHHQVVLLDHNNYHTFQPLLYQVATAGVEPSAISFPLRRVFAKRKDVHIRVCSALNVLSAKKELETSIGTIGYDYLVIATGCTTNFFGNNALEKTTMQLKSTSEALFDRNTILNNLESALNTSDQVLRQRLLTFVVVGGGATGVELAGALGEMQRFLLPADYPDLDVSQMKVLLVDAGPRLLGNFSERSSAYTLKQLTDLGIDVRLQCAVKSYVNGELVFADGSTVTTDTVFWVGGVKPNAMTGLMETAYSKRGRIEVNTFNQVKGYKDVFALGDTAQMTLPEYPNGHPQVVQPAIQQAKCLARNMKRLRQDKPLKPFRYHDRGSMATIGRGRAVLEVGKFRLHGFFAWAIWLFIHLMSIVGVKNRLFIFFDWMLSYLSYNQSLRILIKPVVHVEADATAE